MKAMSSHRRIPFSQLHCAAKSTQKAAPGSERKRGESKEKDPARRNYIIWCQIASGVALLVFLFRVCRQRRRIVSWRDSNSF